MSDTLLEPEDQTGEHQVTKSGACAIPDCPCRGWSAQETASETQFWVSHHGSDWHLKGAPCAQCDGEHQPAVRGGGEEWYVGGIPLGAPTFQRYVTDGLNAICLVSGNSDKEVREVVEQIVAEHNQHQSLVAERERLRNFLGDALHYSDHAYSCPSLKWLENYRDDDDALEVCDCWRKNALAASNQQRSTSA